ncbi:MAG: hypothetical protein AAGA31_09325 [Bacteroidota bacterium]
MLASNFLFHQYFTPTVAPTKGNYTINMTDMVRPSERLTPVLLQIETAVAVAYSLYPRLRDKDLEFVYDAFHTFFKGEVQDRNLPEPTSISPIRDETIGLIFQLLDQAEEEDQFAELLDGSFAPGGTPLKIVEELYVAAFSYLRKSVKFWRKNVGERGYLQGPITELGPVIIDEE